MESYAYQSTRRSRPCRGHRPGTPNVYGTCVIDVSGSTGAGFGGSPGSTTACNPYDVYGFALGPPTATNELGGDHTRSVTATVSGPAGKLVGWPVSCTVTGPHAGTAGTCVPAACPTGADGTATFTYSVPVTSASLGTDGITATVTINSDNGTRSVTKKWVDTTPPTATCAPGSNPGGTIGTGPRPPCLEGC